MERSIVFEVGFIVDWYKGHVLSTGEVNREVNKTEFTIEI